MRKTHSMQEATGRVSRAERGCEDRTLGSPVHPPAAGHLSDTNDRGTPRAAQEDGTGAQAEGEGLTEVVASGRAPCCSSTVMTCVWPCCAAWCRGV